MHMKLTLRLYDPNWKQKDKAESLKPAVQSPSPFSYGPDVNGPIVQSPKKQWPKGTVPKKPCSF